MKNRLIYLGFFVFINFILFSCSDNSTLRHYNLNFELNEPIPNLRENDPLPQYLKVLVNYIETNCTTDLLAPNVTFIRNDIKQPNTHNLEPPLTWINNFRNSHDMLPAEFLKDDYDKLIGDLKTPKILVEPKGTIKSKDTSVKDKNNDLVLNIGMSDSLAIYTLKQRIIKRLCASKGNITINIKVVNITVPDSIVPFITIIPLSYDVPREAGKRIFKVSSNIEWQVKTDSPYCTLNVTNGNRNDSVIVKYDKNKGYEKRSAELTFTGMGVSKQTVTITQEGTNPPPPPPPVPPILPKSLEEFIQIIADKSIPYTQKNNLKKEIIRNYFENENSQVVERVNGTEVSHSSIKDFVEELSQQHPKIEVLEKKTNSNQKITKLYIKEL